MAYLEYKKKPRSQRQPDKVFEGKVELRINNFVYALVDRYYLTDKKAKSKIAMIRIFAQEVTCTQDLLEWYKNFMGTLTSHKELEIRAKVRTREGYRMLVDDYEVIMREYDD